MWNIDQFNAIVGKYLYNCYEKYSQFINTYDDMLNDEEENFDYHNFDELFENFTNNCERLSRTIVRNVDLSLIFNKIIILWCI
jgi:hypothetical protein